MITITATSKFVFTRAMIICLEELGRLIVSEHQQIVSTYKLGEHVFVDLPTAIDNYIGFAVRAKDVKII